MLSKMLNGYSLELELEEATLQIIFHAKWIYIEVYFFVIFFFILMS